MLKINNFILDHNLLINMDEPMDLWVKAGSDTTRMSGDPISHELFMILLLKAEAPTCRFNVRTLNETKMPAEFKAVWFLGEIIYSRNWIF